jgi:hypothetical protein
MPCYLVGLDEAGYGPNLGPLVVAATAWRLPDDHDGDDLYDLLASAVVRPGEAASADPRIAIGDSKVLYQARGTLAVLERGVLAALATLGREPNDAREVFRALCGEAAGDWEEEMWKDGWESSVPMHAQRDDVASCAVRLAEALDSAAAGLADFRAVFLVPRDFNRRVAAAGNKATVLSETTLDLLAGMLPALAGGPVRVVCDKHGGRNHYAGLLRSRLPAGLVQVLAEGRQESRYRVPTPDRCIEVTFRLGGDRLLPAALASMAAKYLRELAMRAFNQFWQRRVPGLKATAGYPHDAHRFMADIAAELDRLGLNRARIWRER